MTVSLLIIKIKQTVSTSDLLEDLYAEQTRYVSNRCGIPAASKIEFWSIKIIKSLSKITQLTDLEIQPKLLCSANTAHKYLIYHVLTVNGKFVC